MRAGRIILDLFNEPDGFGLKWEQPTIYNAVLYPSLPDLLGGAMTVRVLST